MNAKQYEIYKQAVEHNLKGLEFVSTGACPGCEECGLENKTCPDCDGAGVLISDEGRATECEKCQGQGTIEPTEHETELAGEPHFSWSACEACGSSLGGNREPAHGRTKDGSLLHFSVCADCVYFLNYGQLDDTTMQEIEASKA